MADDEPCLWGLLVPNPVCVAFGLRTQDVVGFTTIAQQIHPQLVMGMLNKL